MGHCEGIALSPLAYRGIAYAAGAAFARKKKSGCHAGFIEPYP